MLHVVEALGGGVQSALIDHLRSVPEFDHVVLGPPRPGHATGEALVPPAKRWVPCPRRLDRAAYALHRIHRRLRPDVVHAHSSFAGVWVRASAIPTRRIVYTPHCYAFERVDLSPLVRRTVHGVERALAPRTGVVAAVSPREAELASDLSNGAARIVYVPNVARVADVSPAEPVERTVLGIGRFSAQKDPYFFADVAGRLRDEGWRFTWIGDGPDAYRSVLEANGVALPGWRTREQVLDTLASSAVYLHTAAWEGAPVTLLEAAALGRPIVGRRIPALASLGVEGLGDTPAEVADSIRALGDPDALRAASDASRQLDARHSGEAQRRGLLEAYAAVLGTAPDAEVRVP
ncbi:glycosyl transferase [Egicoccus halophilus]|uniref:Glycosyl transferase n=1 Tax=Egicoccus halophilus TaxID=1670830 RepID=A0A8J3A9A6_9ACTN|nr:glycosyl transferase [Egicoccus halophilus]